MRAEHLTTILICQSIDLNGLKILFNYNKAITM